MIKLGKETNHLRQHHVEIMDELRRIKNDPQLSLESIKGAIDVILRKVSLVNPKPEPLLTRYRPRRQKTNTMPLTHLYQRIKHQNP